VIGEKPGEHAANLVGGDGNSSVTRGLRDAGNKLCGKSVKRRINRAAARAQSFQHGESGSHGQGISAEGSSLIDRAKRRDLVHQRGWAAVCTNGESSANHLA
jgi:hypothetical protein